MSLDLTPPPKRSGRILVIRGGAIGDFIVTLPVFAALRRHFPTINLEVMGYPHIASLASIDGTVDRVIPIDSRPLAGFFARKGDLDTGISEHFASCDVIFSYLFDPDEIFRTNIGRVTQAQVIQAPHRPFETSPMSAASQLLVPLERLAIFDADPVPRIVLPIPPTRKRNLIGLHSGSGSALKNWPIECWSVFIESLIAQTSHDLMLIGGEAERDALERLAPLIPFNRLQIAKNCSLPDLARELASCGSFIGHDSGITHLAAAVGTPVLALWGPSKELIWRPGGDAVQTLSHPSGLLSIEPAEVFRHFRLFTQIP